MWGKRNPHTLLVGIATTMKISIKVSQKAKRDLSYDLTIPFFGIYLKECKPIHKRNIDIPIFIVALFTIAKLWNQLRCPTTNG
jgi:hypothetical protein